MHQASVGFHCTECVAQDHTRVVRARGIRGFQPILTMVLVGINVAVWLLGQILWKPTNFINTSDGAIRAGGLFANAIQVQDGRGVGELIGVAHGEWYRLLSAGFIHVSIFHLAINMWALWVLGRVTEQLLGRTKMGLIYFVSLFAGSFGALLVSPHSVTVGASGAIFGLMGGLLMVAKARGVAMRDTGLLGVLVINLVLTFGLSSYISVGAHIGGLIGGGIAGLLVVDFPNRMRAAGRRTRDAATWGIGVALCLAFIVAAIAVARSQDNGRVTGIAAPAPIVSTQSPARRPD
jgi:membrane associated rhomboid family serine protease